MNLPLLVLAGCVAVGCAVGGDVGAAGGLVLVGLGGFLALVAVCRPGQRSSGAALAAAALAVGAAGAGAESLEAERQPLGQWLRSRGGYVDRPVVIEGIARGDGQDWPDRTTVVLDALGVTGPFETPLPNGRVRVDIGGQTLRPEIRDGDRLRLHATLAVPRRFGNPGAFDAEAAARHEGIVARGSCKTAALVTPLGRGDVGVLRGALADARSWARRQFRAYVGTGIEEGLVRAMVLGDRTGVDEDTNEAFRRAGTLHVLALSGAQIALVAVLLLGLFRRARLDHRASALATALAIGVYAAFVGGDVPVVRAAFMTAVVLGGRLLDLDADLANLLGFAAATLLVLHPSNLFDVGFQLSFGATLGLVALTGPILRFLPRLPWRADAAIAGSLAAQAPLVPVLAGTFHRLAPGALILNLLAVPLSTAVLLAGLGVLATSFYAPLGRAAGGLAWWSAHALLRSADPAGWWPGLAPRLASPDLLALLGYALGLGLVFRSGRLRSGLLVVAGACAFMVVPRTAAGDGRLHLTVLDVGQGDALVLRSPSGRVRMVDAGGTYEGRFDVGESVVAPYLWSEGIGALDSIAVTHAHPDHSGGVPALLHGFSVGSLWEGPAPRRDPGYARLMEEVVASGVPRRTVGRGVFETWDGVSVRVLGPPPPPFRPLRVRNDDSLVLEIGLGGVRFLLTGDVEGAGEAVLDLRPVVALKVPHHGSRSSSSDHLLDRARPSLALVSAGFRNRFSHPDPAVMARYRDRGASIYTTAADGAITVATDGTRIWVKTFRGTGLWSRLQ